MIDLGEVLAALDASGGWLCLSAPTGAGKSTALARLPREHPDRVPELWLAQPTIANVHALARRVGGDVGIGAGGRRTYTDRTPLKIMTAGHALNQVLRRIGAGRASPLVVVVDEAHDRGVPTAGLVAALRHAPGVRVVLASATADWSGCPAVLAVPGGRGWPRRSVPAPDPPPRAYAAAVEACHALLDRAVAEHPPGVGGVVFLAGERCVRLFIQRARHRHPRARFVAVHGGDAAARAVAAPPGGVYVATDAAETGVTLPGVRWVVDSGFHNRAVEDPVTGAVQLAPHRIDSSSATQRAGRANRCGAGAVYQALAPDRAVRPAARAPGELLMLALKLRRHGLPVDEVEALGPAPIAAELGLVDGAGGLTAAGRAAAVLPLRSPRAAAFLAKLRATADPATAAAACCAVAIAELDPGAGLFAPPGRKRGRREPEAVWRRSDDLEAAAALLGAAFEAEAILGPWCREHGIDRATIETVMHQAQQLWAALGDGPMPAPELRDAAAARRTAADVLPVLERPSLSPRGGGATYQLGDTVYAIDRYRSLSRLPSLHRVAGAPPRLAALQLFGCRGRPPLVSGVIALPADAPTAPPRAPVVASDDEWG